MLPPCGWSEELHPQLHQPGSFMNPPTSVLIVLLRHTFTAAWYSPLVLHVSRFQLLFLNHFQVPKMDGNTFLRARKCLSGSSYLWRRVCVLKKICTTLFILKKWCWFCVPDWWSDTMHDVVSPDNLGDYYSCERKVRRNTQRLLLETQKNHWCCESGFSFPVIEVNYAEVVVLCSPCVCMGWGGMTHLILTTKGREESGRWKNKAVHRRNGGTLCSLLWRSFLRLEHKTCVFFTLLLLAETSWHKWTESLTSTWRHRQVTKSLSDDVITETEEWMNILVGSLSLCWGH